MNPVLILREGSVFHFGDREGKTLCGKTVRDKDGGFGFNLGWVRTFSKHGTKVCPRCKKALKGK